MAMPTLLPKRRAKPALDKLSLFEDIGYQPHPGQLQVHSSQAPRRVLACGVRWGKSTCASMEGIAAVLRPCKASLGWVVAPTYDLSDRVFRNIRAVIQRHLPHRVVEFEPREHRIVVRNLGGGLSELRAKSADNAVSLLGEGLDWLVVDEAARMKHAIWESHLSQRLIDRDGWALLVSTPRGAGIFHDLYKMGLRGEPGYESWNFPSWTNPYLNKDVVERERKRLRLQLLQLPPRLSLPQLPHIRPRVDLALLRPGLPLFPVVDRERGNPDQRSVVSSRQSQLLPVLGHPVR